MLEVEGPDGWALVGFRFVGSRSSRRRVSCPTTILSHRNPFCNCTATRPSPVYFLNSGGLSGPLGNRLPVRGSSQVQAISTACAVLRRVPQ